MPTIKTTKVLLVALVAILASSCNDNSPARIATFEGTIETFAGTTFGHDGDGGLAKAAKLGYVTGVSIDASSNVYISDAAANTIRKVTNTHEISTIAGVFLGFNAIDPDTYSGEGGPATNAHLNVPLSLAADANGNVYVTDTGNNALRKVSSTGYISIIVGGVNTGSSGDNGPAASALINRPNGIAFDAAGNLYFADSQNHLIRKISTSGEITTIAGTPEQPGYSGDGGDATAAKLRFPNGIAVDSDGNIYFSDNNSVVRRISSSGKITTIAGTGEEGYSGDGEKATTAKLLAPRGIAIGIDGSILIADAGNNRIRRIIPETEIIETIAGTGEAGYSGDGGQSVNAKLSNPQGIAVGTNGYIYVAESGSSVIRLIKPAN